MKKIIIVVLILIPGQALAVDAVQGQYLFDQVFWLIMQIFCLGLSFGLAVKMINRS